MIEIKSEYTYRHNKEINDLKRDAVLKAGIGFKFMIFTNVNENNVDFYFLKNK